MFMGIDALSSVAYADGKVFVGSDTYSIYAINATTGSKISSYETGDQVISSPAIWENKIYVGSNDWNVYCFSNGPTVSTSITAGSNKLQVLTNESLVISGQLTPGIPNAQITVALTTPDSSSIDLSTSTDQKGFFSMAYSPSTAGDWSWTAKYDGNQLPTETYTQSSTDTKTFKVQQTQSSPSPSSTPGPTPAVTNSMYIYGGIAATIFVIVIAAVGYIFVKRTR